MKDLQNSRIIINAMPKSGTHLLSNIVQILGYHNVLSHKGAIQKKAYKKGIGYPKNLCYKHIHKNVRLRFYKRFGAFLNNGKNNIPIGVMSPTQVPVKLVRKWLRQIPIGYFIIGHVPHSREFEEILMEGDFQHILIIRDPRDVLLSFLHYSTKPGHWLRADLLCLSEDERMLFALKGGYAPKSRTHIIGTINAFRSLMDWTQSKKFLMVRFEDLIGTQGEGSYDTQYYTVKRICNHLGIEDDEKIVVNTCKQAFNVKSPTFRKGKIAAWKSEFTEKQLQLFNKYGGELLHELCYQ